MTRRDSILLFLIAVLAAVVRIVAVNFPPRTVVDEFWYARDGCFYWRASAEECGMANLVAPDRDVATWLATYGELTPEHPPLAKWLIGTPMALLGYSPGAWRLASVGVGVVTVVLLYLLAKKAFASTMAAAGASGLLAVDYPHLVHSRLAMLEIFVALFGVAAFYFGLLDRAQIVRRAEGRPSHRRWRLATGLAGGGAAACKLSGVAIVAGVFALVVAWEITAQRRSQQGLRAAGKEALSIVLLLGVVPVAVYMTTYLGRLDGSLLLAPWVEGSWAREWVERQSYMLRFHADKPPASTPPWALPMTEKPLSYVLERSDARVREILLFGNPLLWWGGFAAVVYAAARWARGERTLPAALVVISFVASYAGWLSLTLTRRNVHLFYAVPVAPFLYLALAFVGVRVAASRAGRIGAAAVVTGAAVAFAFYLPILTGRPLELGEWRPRACSAHALWLARVEGCGLAAKHQSSAPVIASGENGRREAFEARALGGEPEVLGRENETSPSVRARLSRLTKAVRTPASVLSSRNAHHWRGPPRRREPGSCVAILY